MSRHPARLFLSDWMVAAFYGLSVLSKVLALGGDDRPALRGVEGWVAWLASDIVQVVAVVIETSFVALLFLPRTRSVGRFALLGLSLSYLVLAAAMEIAGYDSSACGCFGDMPIRETPKFILLVGASLLCISSVQRDRLQAEPVAID